jgi:hypothetical protein
MLIFSTFQLKIITIVSFCVIWDLSKSNFWTLYWFFQEFRQGLKVSLWNCCAIKQTFLILVYRLGNFPFSFHEQFSKLMSLIDHLKSLTIRKFLMVHVIKRNATWDRVPGAGAGGVMVRDGGSGGKVRSIPHCQPSLSRGRVTLLQPLTVIGPIYVKDYINICKATAGNISGHVSNS